VTIKSKKYLNADYYRFQLQTQRGIPHLNRITNTQVMVLRSTILGSYSENHGNTEKYNMKVGQKCDHQIQEIFECRLLEISITNSKRYPTSKSDSTFSSYGI